MGCTFSALSLAPPACPVETFILGTAVIMSSSTPSFSPSQGEHFLWVSYIISFNLIFAIVLSCRYFYSHIKTLKKNHIRELKWLPQGHTARRVIGSFDIKSSASKDHALNHWDAMRLVDFFLCLLHLTVSWLKAWGIGHSILKLHNRCSVCVRWMIRNLLPSLLSLLDLLPNLEQLS